MIQELSNLVVADNTGAKRAMCFRILKQRKEYVFNAPDWYTKVNVRLTDEFTLEPDDKMYDDFEADRKSVV